MQVFEEFRRDGVTWKGLPCNARLKIVTPNGAFVIFEEDGSLCIRSEENRLVLNPVASNTVIIKTS